MTAGGGVYGAQPVYPRWRGEHMYMLNAALEPAGLSPLARGTYFGDRMTGMPPRFIPAGAGNIPGMSPAAGILSVYPRWRGEHIHKWTAADVFAGLSPLARGTSWRTVLPAPHLAVYPRWRGEHLILMYRLSWQTGLSPLARGTSANYGGSCLYHRFIPAGAGNISGERSGAEKDSVYPRWRGEHHRY